MSHNYSAGMNKHPKTHFEQYLNNSGEPEYNVSSDSPAELEAELLENSYFMKRRIRSMAKRMRDRYS